jgi:hypothetical protein
LGLLATAGRRKRSAPSHSHGSSRWATTRELGAAGLLRDAGVVLCQVARRFASGGRFLDELPKELLANDDELDAVRERFAGVPRRASQ